MAIHILSPFIMAVQFRVFLLGPILGLRFEKTLVLYQIQISRSMARDPMRAIGANIKRGHPLPSNLHLFPLHRGRNHEFVILSENLPLENFDWQFRLLAGWAFDAASLPPCTGRLPRPPPLPSSLSSFLSFFPFKSFKHKYPCFMVW